MLDQLFDFSLYRPTTVKFKYVHHGEGRAPGPSDWSVQGVMYFDSTTFEKILEVSRATDFPSSDYENVDFTFDILEPEVNAELLNCDTSYHGHPDLFFKSGANSGLWLLKRKILFYKYTT